MAEGEGQGQSQVLKKGRPKSVGTCPDDDYPYLKPHKIVSTSDIPRYLEGFGNLMVVFKAERCGYCRRFTPTLEKLAASFHEAIAAQRYHGKERYPDAPELAVCWVDADATDKRRAPLTNLEVIKEMFPEISSSGIPLIIFFRPGATAGSFLAYPYGMVSSRMTPDNMSRYYPGVEMEIQVDDGKGGEAKRYLVCRDFDGKSYHLPLDEEGGQVPNPFAELEVERTPSLLYGTIARFYGFKGLHRDAEDLPVPLGDLVDTTDYPIVFVYDFAPYRPALVPPLYPDMVDVELMQSGMVKLLKANPDLAELVLPFNQGLYPIARVVTPALYNMAAKKSFTILRDSVAELQRLDALDAGGLSRLYQSHQSHQHNPFQEDK